jgi:hypothetical protein
MNTLRANGIFYLKKKGDKAQRERKGMKQKSRKLKAAKKTTTITQKRKERESNDAQ